MSVASLHFSNPICPHSGAPTCRWGKVALDSIRPRRSAGYGCVTQMHLVPLLAPRLENENHMNDIDFSPRGIGMRRAAGYEAAMRALERAPWQGEFDPIEGIILHEAVPDLPAAAE